MYLEVKLSEQDKIDLLNAQVLLKRLGTVPANRLASVANIAASKISDVLQLAKDEQPINPPF